MPKSSFDDDIVFSGKILRYYRDAATPAIKERTDKGGWKILCHGTKAQMDVAWNRMWNDQDEGKEAVSTGTSMVIRDKADQGKEINISESELKRENQKPNAFGFSPGTVIRYHDAAQQFGRMAVLCAAKAGAELNQIKANCKHGEWLKIIELMPFSAETARNYRKLADQMTERFLEQGGEIDLLSIPEPEHLADPEYAETLRRVQRITGEQGLRQLYSDWGIMREPKALGGARDKKPTPLTQEQVQEFAEQDVLSLITDIQTLCIGEDRKIQMMEVPTLRLLEGDLIDALKNVRTLIKAG